MTADWESGIAARVRERAYYLWLEEGRPHGRDNEHWRRAERELIEQATGRREDSPATSVAHGAEACGAPEASAERTVLQSCKNRQDPAAAEATGASRSRAKSRVTDRSETTPRVGRSRPPAMNLATSSGSRASRRLASAKPVE